MNRRSVITALLASPVAFVPIVARRLKGAAATPTHDVVRQTELQAAIDLCAKAESTVIGLRERLEAGAVLQRGRLGASTYLHGQISRCVDVEHGIDGQLFCLTIAPVEDLAADVEWERQQPNGPDLGWVVA